MTIQAAEARLDASAEAVFAAVTDLSQWGKWLTIHAGWPDGIPAHMEKGTRLREHASLFGLRDTVTLTVTEYDPPSAFAFLAEGNYGGAIELTIRVSPAATGGSVITLQGRLVGKLAQPLRMLVDRRMDANLQQSLRKLEIHLPESIVSKDGGL